ncbi:hypothetical protein [Bradyrhizobium paxllaeri]|uniref:hypothetical protein n=1 Tax=Bradyrhizobium paxllaeri TaxID=190148 RepID=UPI00114778B8|nr:hypothetical protein [Bradyrhizobium paxllaeri]
MRYVAYRVLTPDGRKIDSVATLPSHPSPNDVRQVVNHLLDGGAAEHVVVLQKDRRTDMFVDEQSHLKHLRRNEAATALFRAAALRGNPHRDPETLPYIAGPAIVFDEPVWPKTKFST